MCYCRCCYEDYMGNCRKGPEVECPEEEAIKRDIIEREVNGIGYLSQQELDKIFEAIEANEKEQTP